MTKIPELYYFSTNGKVYGPFLLDEFLSIKLPDSSYIFNNRDQEWILANRNRLNDRNSFIENIDQNKKERDEIKRTSLAFNLEKKQSNPVVNNNNTSKISDLKSTADLEYPNVEQTEDNKKSYTKLLIIAGVIVTLFALWKFTRSNEENNGIAEVALVDTAAVAVDTTSIADSTTEIDKLGDIYKNILSISEIQQNQIDNLSFSDILDYKNEMLARHGFVFEEPTLLENYKKKEWYRPENNYLVATSGFNEIEKYNFTLLENKMQDVYNQLSNNIKAFYNAIVDKTFDANNYFSEKVETFITKSDLDPWLINEEMKNHYNEFTESKYEFADPIPITLIKSENGINYISFKFYYSTYRVSKSKQQSCNVTIEWGLDRNQKISSYKEIKIENLKFNDPNNNVDSTE